MLRASVCGTIFASPSVKQIYNCIAHRVGPSSGVLLIVMNYTGDVLHFGLATEKARAHGVNVDMVVVGDDVGVGREKSGKVGRRGIAGTVIVQKITGAYAATGATLEQCASLARLVAENLVSVGSSLAHVHVPGTEAGIGLSLKDGEVELGMGIHNEAGSTKLQSPSLSALVKTMLSNLLSTSDGDRSYLSASEPPLGWVLMINNLGGVSPLELAAITTEVTDQLHTTHSITPRRIYSGTFMTSLNGLGFSITLLRLVDACLAKHQSLIELLDTPHETTSWLAPIHPATWDASRSNTPAPPLPDDPAPAASGITMDIPSFNRTLTAGLRAVIKSESEITHLDTLVGDGDCGRGLARGATAILNALNTPAITSDAVASISNLANIVEESMDGTSGALYSIFLNALAGGLREQGKCEADPEVWAKAAERAMEGLARYTPARPGDRTLVDALAPFVEALTEGVGLKVAAERGRGGADKTRGMKPSLGRTVYVEDVGDVADPGAVGVAVFVEGMAGA